MTQGERGDNEDDGEHELENDQRSSQETGRGPTLAVSPQGGRGIELGQEKGGIQASNQTDAHNSSEQPETIFYRKAESIYLYI